ncbi:unnamed protein product [Rangifer tarandus platyrhynchus]|uniref:Uncharacterized protein n=1 Tax=Rangifer tarandus platyrhynchus TaxID=3082113 RepID=A0AC59Z3W6_RANTA
MLGFHRGVRGCSSDREDGLHTADEEKSSVESVLTWYTVQLSPPGQWCQRQPGYHPAGEPGGGGLHSRC